VGLIVRDETHGGAPVYPYLGTQAFVLAWSDNYSLLINNNLVLGIENQRQWSVTGPRASHVQLIEN
jgi:hypothetical protein